MPPVFAPKAGRNTRSWTDNLHVCQPLDGDFLPELPGHSGSSSLAYVVVGVLPNQMNQPVVRRVTHLIAVINLTLEQ